MPTLDISQQQPLLHHVLTQPHTSLTLVHHNIQCVLPHLRTSNATRRWHLQNCRLTETRMKPEPTITLPTGYDLHRQDRCVPYAGMPDRQQQHGGAAILSHKFLKAHHACVTHCKLDYACVNCTDHSITIAAVYRPPSYKIDSFLQQMRDLMTDLWSKHCDNRRFRWRSFKPCTSIVWPNDTAWVQTSDRQANNRKGHIIGLNFCETHPRGLSHWCPGYLLQLPWPYIFITVA